jgi:hypothetical protein
MRLDRICSNDGSALPLRLRGRAGVGVPPKDALVERIDFPHPTRSGYAERVDLPRKRERWSESV